MLGSDMDISVAIRDADIQGISDGWQTRLAAITPTVTARHAVTGEGGFCALTTTCERFDVISEPVRKLASTSPEPADRGVRQGRLGVRTCRGDPAAYARALRCGGR
jgi:hypothetical protein